MVTRGFLGRRLDPEIAKRIPPGQYLERGFPVLTAGPTFHVPIEQWSFTLKDGPKPIASWTWDEFHQLPQTTWTHDIHCVTKWSKLDTTWTGVLIDDILAAADFEPSEDFTLQNSFDGYSTNVPFEDLTEGKAMIATRYDGEAIAAEHGGPARMVIPHLYFWKSAKWIANLQFTRRDEPGFWENRGYHMYGDPWREQRYSFDE
jgi:DMSO/TMAO reductase YedYZ molybdopterin-dependent catalytic subunit